MSRNYTEHTKKPATDQKFAETDEHLVAESKEEVAKINQGDALEPAKGHDRNRNAPDEKKRGR